MKLRSISSKVVIIISLILVLLAVAVVNYYFARVIISAENEIKMIVVLEKSFSDLLLQEFFS